MSRFLFVVPQFVGHVNPAVSVAVELAERGHGVAWAAPTRIRPLLPDDAVMHSFDDVLVEELRASFAHRAGRGRGIANDFKCFWEELVFPLARGTLGDVERAIDRYEPDALVVDQHALAGALAARRRGIAWATLAPTAFLTTDEVLEGLPKVRDWLVARLLELQHAAGLEPVATPDRSPQLVVAFSIPDLTGRPVSTPAHYRFVGTALEHRSGLGDREDTFPWDELRDGPRLLASLGSVNTYRHERFFATVVEALAGLPLQVILIAPPELVPVRPDNVLVVPPYVNNLALLPHVQAVLCHGGHGTVHEALAHGVPVVVAPVTFDQPLVAEQVVAAGVGIRVRSVRTSPAELRKAVEAVFNEPAYRRAASSVGASLRAAGGAGAAADELERLVGS